MKKIYLNTLTPEEIIKRLKDGEIIKATAKDVEYKMVDGVLCWLKAGALISVCSEIFVYDKDCGYYFEEQEEFKVEKIGKYKTRDGRIAWVSYIDPPFEISYGCLNGFNELCRWNNDGSVRRRDKCLDLVEYVGD